MDHHPTLSPSSLPMLARCPCFERADSSTGAGGKYVEHGQRLHEAFAQALLDYTVMLDGRPIALALTPQELENVLWAVDKVRLHATSAYPIEVETRLTLTHPDTWEIITYGTADVLNGLAPWLADLKTLDAHDYWHQMACYALMKMQRDGGDRVMVHVLYCRDQRTESLEITKAEAEERLYALFEQVQDARDASGAGGAYPGPWPTTDATPNEFCKWCRHLTTCPAVAKQLAAVAAGNEWAPVSFKAVEITTAPEMAKALAMARLLAAWSEEIESMAKAMVAKGEMLPGWRRVTRQGSRFIDDSYKAFELSGLPPEKFRELITVSLGAIEEAVAQQEGMSPKHAKAKVAQDLAEVIKRRSPISYLTLDKKANNQKQLKSATNTNH